MSRRKSAVKRPVAPDPRYDSQTVTKFVANLMLDGKKGLAESIFYSAMDLIEERTSQPGVAVFKQALNNVVNFITPIPLITSFCLLMGIHLAIKMRL